MFVGHYSVAFAVRTEQNKIPLWVLFVAVQFLDYIWATLVLLGIEKLRVIKGFTAGSMLDSYFHPYSHSLIAAVLWSGVAGLCYKLLCRWLGYGYTKSAALVVGAAVFSHWILDLIAHPHDLPVYDNTAKVGFGLWNYRDPEFALEIALLALGIALYLARNVMPAIRKAAVIAFGIALVVIQIGDTYVPRAPLSDKATALGVWIFYTLFVFIALLVERIGARPQTNAPGSDISPDMETPLTPLEFARRARKVYPEQIAVIDGESRWSYAQFLDRCDRWSAVLQRLGVGAGDRVAYLAPNTHAQLESFYSVPQLGAVLVPLNFRLTADDFLYLINHSGARVVCAHRDYLEAINNIRSHLPCVEHFVALTGEANDWLEL